MKNVVLRNITVKADELSRQYEKTKDSRIRDQWFKLIRSVPPLQEPVLVQRECKDILDNI